MWQFVGFMALVFFAIVLINAFLTSVLFYRLQETIRTRNPFGPPYVPRLKEKSNIRGLVQALSYEKSAAVRAKAASALGELGASKDLAQLPLVNTLGDTDPGVRRCAADALGYLRSNEAPTEADRIRDERVTEALLKALEDPDNLVCRAAARSLGRKGNGRAVAPIVANLARMDSYGRQDFFRSLAQIGDVEALDALDTAIKLNPDDTAAISALVHIQDPRAVRPLIVQLAGGHWWEGDIIGNLQRIGDPAISALVGLLRDRDWRLRKSSAEALDKLGWRPDEGEDGSFYYAAAGAWDRCADAGDLGREPLFLALETGDRDIRASAAWTLRKVRNDSVTYRLLAALRDSDPDVRWQAAEALRESGWEPPADEEGAFYWMARREWALCADIGAEAVGALKFALDTAKTMDPRIDAMYAIARIRAPSVIPVLLPLLRDPEEWVRCLAADALSRNGWYPGHDEDSAYYWMVKPDAAAEWEKRLAEIGAAAVGPLVAAIKGKNRKIQLGAVKALAAITDIDALKALIAARQDPDWRVQYAAAAALDGLGWQPKS